MRDKRCQQENMIMVEQLTQQDVKAIAEGYDQSPMRSSTIKADAYTKQAWFDLEQQTLFARSWQWVCHVESLREPGAYIAAEVAGVPVFIVRGQDGELRGFYNVCKHRGHHLLQGQGQTKRITCPYHAWTYDLQGQLRAAPRTQGLENFDKKKICLDRVAVEEFCGFIFVNLDPQARPLAEQTEGLRSEITSFAPDIEKLTFAYRKPTTSGRIGKASWTTSSSAITAIAHTRISAHWSIWRPTRSRRTVSIPAIWQRLVSRRIVPTRSKMPPCASMRSGGYGLRLA
jgi:nitrite reductase/ring-hydroxylating ferredoxin subunit